VTIRQGFDAEAFLQSSGEGKGRGYGRAETIFMQGDACRHLFFIRSGGITLSVRSASGKEAIVAVLGPGEFFGEECMAGQAQRTGSATAMTPSTIMAVSKPAMERLLQQQPEMSERFIAHILSRNARLEADLIDQLFNSTEKRLARALLLLANYGSGRPVRDVPRISQEMLGAMIGATRSQVNGFLNGFKRLGFIEYGGRRPLKVNNSLLQVVLND
jgi:CRP/FNR family transcriptional regulator, cyclic AMP receptor protein